MVIPAIYWLPLSRGHVPDVRRHRRERDRQPGSGLFAKRVGAGGWSTRPGLPRDACLEPVAWVGRWKFLNGWTKVWSC